MIDKCDAESGVEKMRVAMTREEKECWIAMKTKWIKY
jgi:hypothetical protein